MSSIVTAVFKATIGLLMNKGRDKVAEILKDGDVTDRKFHSFIVREIDDIKSKLDALSRKDLGASISFFEEGIALLYEVFDKARFTSECVDGGVTAQAVCDEALSLVEGISRLELTGLDESASRKLSSARERFKDARRKATEAFKNESLDISDRILAMHYRVMATILETVDNPADAVAPCRVCVKELNCLPAVQNSFRIHLKTGIQAVRGLFNQEERRKIISGVCHVNRVIYDVTLTVGKDENFLMWPHVTECNKVDPLRDERVLKVLLHQGMEHCSLLRSFGQEATLRYGKLKRPMCITTNSKGGFIIGELDNTSLKVFDSSGKGPFEFNLTPGDVNTKLSIYDVATDMKDSLFVLTRFLKSESEECFWVFVIPDLTQVFRRYRFLLRKRDQDDGYQRLSVNGRRGILTLRGKRSVEEYNVDNGEFVHSFGEGILKGACDITVANDDQVLVLDSDDFSVYVFSRQGDHLNKFKLHGANGYNHPKIAFHLAGEHVVVADSGKESYLLHVELFTKDGELLHSAQIRYKEITYPFAGVAVTPEGRIALLAGDEVLIYTSPDAVVSHLF